MTNPFARLGREPVLIGAAVLAWIDVLKPSDLIKAALVATIAVIVRAYSSPKVAVEEAQQSGYAQGVSDIGSLASPPQEGIAAPPMPGAGE